ncbi:MAG TPA: tRNA uridine-5-carboxymethylaminomethyl(34) synthesis GTPase MnmE [bacterium]|nr:tRNA uridine-5-carboxymethylaminomethyl(34) synthesis GTPase MnmE [bacterium]
MSDTVAAVATALGEGGVAIVRLTGPRAVEIAAKVARGADLVAVPTHTVHHAWIHDAGGHPLDEALITVMRAPRTYTGEDVVEIGAHGGAVPARRVLRAVLAAGARLAERGEFTRRAFVNGRLDLSRAEAVIDLVTARTERAADAALSALAGGVARETLNVESRLLDLLARLEVNLDFNEDVGAAGAEEIERQLTACRQELERLAARAPWGRRLRDGATVAIIGRPNVGKSSLFNALVRDDRAIVNEEPGTTRDWLEAWIDLDGMPVRLLDTAGQRDAGTGAEAEGVRRAERLAADADLRLIVLDASREVEAEDRRVLERTEAAARIIVWNKSDLASGRSRGHDLRVSARTGAGVDALRAELAEALLQGVGREPADAIIPGERHEEALRRAVESLRLADASRREGRTEELIAGDVRDAVTALGEITGKTVDEEVLDRIFSRFCIGK